MRPSTVASVAGRRVLEVLAEMGCRSVLLESEIPLSIALGSDVPVEVDIDDWQVAEQALRRVHAGIGIDAVVSVRDSYVPAAAYLAARLGVRGLALHAALNCHDKARMRQTLDGYGLGNPRYAVAEEPADVVPAAETVGFPLIVKRVRGAGGAGVRLCRDAEELMAAAAELTDPDDLVPLLIEQYLEGPEYAIQTVTLDGTTQILSILAEKVGPPPRFAETGYDYPAGLDLDTELQISEYTSAVLAALGFDHGIAHVQARLTADGPRLIEVNPRPPGGVLTDVTEAVSGVDMVRAAVEVALGVPVTRNATRATHVRYRCVVFDEPGTVEYDSAALADLQQHLDTDTDTDSGVPAPIVSLDVEPGEQVLPVHHPDGGVYGRIVVFGNDPQSLDDRYHAIVDRLALRIHRTNVPGGSS